MKTELERLGGRDFSGLKFFPALRLNLSWRDHASAAGLYKSRAPGHSLTTARFSSMLKILPITLLPEPFLEAYGVIATWSCQRDVPSVPIVCSGSLRAIGRH